MTPLLLFILLLLLYVLVGVVVIEVILWVLALLIPTFPPRLRQLLYAILGICVLIYLVAHLPHIL